MAITVPSIDGPQVQNRGIGAPQLNLVGPDTSGAQLGNQVARAGTQIVAQEIEHADTAAIMGAESQLTNARMGLLYDPSNGAFTKKGANALDVTNQTLPQFDKHVEDISQSLTSPRQKEQFQRIATTQRTQIDQQLNQYEFGQRNQYYDDQDAANVNTSLNAAITQSDDPQQVAYQQAKGNLVLAMQGQRKGLPPEAIQLAQQQFNSKVSVGVISKMATSDPLRAQQYYAQNYSNMDAEGQAQVTKILGHAVAFQQAQNITGNLMSAPVPTVGQGGLPALIMQAESGGDQKALSPKGAVGAMQLLPDTAEEVAKQMGVKYDPERLANDKNYNMALGTTYLNNLVGKYGGNNTLAVAAYNAGPGMVDDWINGTNKTGKNPGKVQLPDPRQGTDATQKFIASIPFKETQQYVSKISAQLNPPSEGNQTGYAPLPPDASFDQRYSRALLSAQQIQDPTVKKAVMSNLAQYKQANEAQEGANYDSAFQQLKAGGFNSIDPITLAKLPPEKQIQLQKFGEHLQKGTEPQTDYKKFEQFLSMPPDQLARLTPSQDMQPFLSKADFSKVMGAWTDAKQGTGAVVQKIEKGKEDIIKTTMQMAGIETGDSKDAQKPDNLAKQQQFRSALQERTDSFYSKEGRQPNLQETQSLANELLLKVKLDRSFWPDKTQQLWETSPEDLAANKANVNVGPGQMKITDIPPQERRNIINVLRANGEVASEPNIISRYIQKISKQGVPVK